MPYAMNAEVRIYYECDGVGPPLVLHHGFTGSGQDWIDDGYVPLLQEHFRLVRLDARGHGRSTKPTDPADYTMELRVRDVVAVLDDADLATAHYLGYSMGGRVGWALGMYAPQRFDSLIIGGAGPDPDPPEAQDQWIGWLRDGTMEDVVRQMEAEWGPLPNTFTAAVLKNDARALWAERIAYRETPSLADAFPSMTMPCLVYAGSEDPRFANAKAAAERLSHGVFVTVAGQNHFEAGDLSYVIPFVMDFLTRRASD